MVRRLLLVLLPVVLLVACDKGGAGKSTTEEGAAGASEKPSTPTSGPAVGSSPGVQKAARLEKCCSALDTPTNAAKVKEGSEKGFYDLAKIDCSLWALELKEGRPLSTTKDPMTAMHDSIKNLMPSLTVPPECMP